MSARALLALVLAVVSVGLLVALGDDDAYRMRAELPTAGGLREGSLVRVGGVDVGRVRDLEVTPADTVLATLELDGTAAPVGRDAALRIRAANLLGEKYVDLTVGDRSRPLDVRRPLAVDRTRTSVDLDDVIDVLDPTTRTRLAILMRETGIALGGRADELEGTLRRMPGAVDDVRALFGEIAADTRTLRGLVRRSDRVLASLAAERADLGRFTATGADVLDTFAGRGADLSSTLRELPPTLGRLRTTLRALDRAGEPLRPAADGLRATAPALTATLGDLPAFTASARPALRTTRAVAPALTRLGRGAAPVVRRLRPAATTLAGLAGDAEPLTRAFDLGAADLLGTMENWARAIQGRDGVSHLFRVSASVDPTVIGALRDYVSGPTVTRRPQRAPAPGPSAPPPAEPSPSRGVERPARPPSRLPVPLPSLPGLDLPAVADRTVEATDETASGLLDFLLSP